MQIKQQMSMVFNLDKCLGCNTCTLACKNVWTNREGAEYMFWNNVETKPGVGYPRKWEDQERYRGGWNQNPGADNPKLKIGYALLDDDEPLLQPRHAADGRILRPGTDHLHL